MSKNIWVKVLCVLVCFTGLMQVHGEELLFMDYGPESVCMVKATVVDLNTNSKGSLIARLKIIDVYSGPSEILNKEFTSLTSDGANWGMAVTPKLVPKEEAIWSVRVVNDSILPVGLFSNRQGSPSRKGIDPNYKEVEILANTIKHICSLKNLSQQIEAVKGAIFHKTPAVSSWAIETLAESKGRSKYIDEGKIDKYINELTLNSQLPIAGQISLDKILLKKEEVTWGTSDKRIKFLEGMVSKAVDTTELYLIAGRLGMMTQHDPLDSTILVSLIEALAKKKVAKNTILVMKTIIKRMSKSGKFKGDSFERLKTLVKKLPDSK